MRIVLLRIFVFIGVAFVIYLSWLPSPQMGLVWFMPDWLARWTDANENETIRTGVPFVLLGIAIGNWLQRKTYPWYYWVASWLSLVTIVLIAEAGQLFLPKRSFDWWDVVWGAIGAVVGIGSAVVAKHLKTILMSD